MPHEEFIQELCELLDKHKVELWYAMEGDTHGIWDESFTVCKRDGAADTRLEIDRVLHSNNLRRYLKENG